MNNISNYFMSSPMIIRNVIYNMMIVFELNLVIRLINGKTLTLYGQIRKGMRKNGSNLIIH